MTTELLVSVEYVSRQLGVTKDTIYRRIEDRGLLARCRGRLWKFKVSEVDECARAGGAEFVDEVFDR